MITDAVRSSPWYRVIWWIALLLAIIGQFVPVLPTLLREVRREKEVRELQRVRQYP